MKNNQKCKEKGIFAKYKNFVDSETYDGLVSVSCSTQP